MLFTWLASCERIIRVGDEPDIELATRAREPRGTRRERERLGELLKIILRDRRRLDRPQVDRSLERFGVGV